jgi:small subunit ribosomal protein S10
MSTFTSLTVSEAISELISQAISQELSELISQAISRELDRELDRQFDEAFEAYYASDEEACASDELVALPTKKHIYCVFGFPHVEKDSREHFEIPVYKRIIEIYYDLEGPIFDLLSEADLPPGIFYRICLS